LYAALRETEEEIGIHRDQVEILGRFGPAELSLNGMRVWPYVGFIHPHRHRTDQSHTANLDTALPSLPLSSLTLSQREVAQAFHLPLEATVSPPRLHNYLFRASDPYFAIDVSDIVTNSRNNANVVGTVAHIEPSDHDRDEVGSGRDGRLEAWGLTGWYLNVFLKVLGIYR